jgi:hypothetical protein
MPLSLAFTLHVHVAYLTERGARHLTPQNAPALMLYPSTTRDASDEEYDDITLSNLFEEDDADEPTPPQRQVKKEENHDDEASRVLLLCLTGHLDRTFMERWSTALDSRFGSFWHDNTRFCTYTATFLLASGYLMLCAPTAVVLVYLFFRAHDDGAYFWLWHSSLALLTSFVLLRVYAHALYKLHYFSSVENQVAYNVNTQLATFFKQYPSTRMKPYAFTVPKTTIARLFLQQHQLTFTTLTYRAPTAENILIPSACEAVDTLRAKSNSRRFVNIVIVTTAGNPEHMCTLYNFFIRSAFHAILSPDKTLVLCVWGHKRTRFRVPMHSNPPFQNHSLTLLPLVFTVHATTSPSFHHDDDEQQPTTPVQQSYLQPLLGDPLRRYNRAFRKPLGNKNIKTFYRRLSEMFFHHPPTTTPYYDSFLSRTPLTTFYDSEAAVVHSRDG